MMKVLKEWKYFHNSQKYSDCQIISAVNAYYFLTGKIIKQNSKRYQKFVDMTGSKSGSAIGIEKKVYPRLKLKVIKEYNSLFYLRYKRHDRKTKDSFNDMSIHQLPLPLEVSIWHHRYGFHSALIIDHEIKCDAYRVTNLKYATTTSGWIFSEEFKYLIVDRCHCSNEEICTHKENWKFKHLGLV